MKKVIEAIYTYTNSFDPYYLDDNISLEEKQEINKVYPSLSITSGISLNILKTICIIFSSN